MRESHATAVMVLGLLFASVNWLMKWDNMAIAMRVCTKKVFTLRILLF